MSERSCELEAAVLAAARTAEWTDDLRRHLEGCPDCTDALMVERFLASESVAAATGTRLPTADQVWWRADLRRRRELAQRARARAARSGVRRWASQASWSLRSMK